MPSLTLRRRRAVVPGRGITVRRSAPGPHSKVLNLGVTNLRRSTLARRTVREHSSTLVWALHRDIHVAAYAVAPIAPPTSNTKWGMRTRQRRLPLERRTVWMGSVVITGVLPLYSTTIVRTHSQQVPAEHGGRVGDVERDRVHRGGLLCVAAGQGEADSVEAGAGQLFDDADGRPGRRRRPGRDVDVVASGPVRPEEREHGPGGWMCSC